MSFSSLKERQGKNQFSFFLLFSFNTNACVENLAMSIFSSNIIFLFLSVVGSPVLPCILLLFHFEPIEVFRRHISQLANLRLDGFSRVGTVY